MLGVSVLVLLLYLLFCFRYFGDFWDAFTSFDNKNFGGDKHYDVTEIDKPLHWIFEYITDCVDNYLNGNNNILSKLVHFPNNTHEFNRTLNFNLFKLFEFGIGLEFETQLQSVENQNILIRLCIAKRNIEEMFHKRNTNNDNEINFMCQLFILKTFKQLINLATLEANRCEIMLAPSKNVFIADKIGTFDGNVLDLCLLLKNYRFFVNVLEILLKKEDESIIPQSTIEQLHYLSNVEMIEMIKCSIGDDLLFSTKFLLPITFNKEDNDRNDNFQSDIIYSLIEHCIHGCVRCSDGR